MKEQETCSFGTHLTIDGYEGNPAKLNDKNLVMKCLNELPSLLGMKIIFGPEVCFAPENDHKDPGGWSGFVMIAESHISCHTFANRGFVSIDVYTCKNGLDKDFVIDYFIKLFELKDVEVNYIVRGTKYPLHNIC